MTRATAGGAEQILAAIDEALRAAGHESVVIANERVDGPFTDDVQREARARIRRAVAAADADVLHFHGLDFAEVMPDNAIPKVVTVHLPPAWYPPAALARADVRYVCVSQSQRARFPGRAEVITNGVDLAAFAPGEGGSGAVALSRICEEKNLHAAVDAAKLADVDLVVAGEVYDYPAHVRYFREVFAPRLDARRRFIGSTGARAELLRSARCALIPSLVEETSSLAAMEALACGTPVIAFRRGALPEIVDDGVTGFLVDDVAQMAEAIGRADRIDRRACRRAAEERFDGRVMLGRYLDLYTRIVSCDDPAFSPPSSAPAPSSRRRTLSPGAGTSPSSRSASSATSTTSAPPTSRRT